MLSWALTRVAFACFNTMNVNTLSAWFEATQAMACLGLISLSLATVAITNYMFFNIVNKGLMLKLSIAFCFVSGE